MSMDFTICERVTGEFGREFWSHGRCDATFNVHNAGGCAILRTLGYEPDSCGTLDPADVLARIALWEAFGDPSGVTVPPSDEYVPSGARIVELGISGPYVRERIRKLAELADLALASGRMVGWS